MANPGGYAQLNKRMDSVRIDKWLWAVRVFKTRSLAAEACRAGHVKIAGQSIKPAREIRAGELITAYNGHLTRTLKVVGYLDKRVGAALAATAFEDLTPEAERTQKAEPGFGPASLVSKGKPSKKERRQLGWIQEQL